MSKDFNETNRVLEVNLTMAKHGDVWAKERKEHYILTLNRMTITQKATANIPKGPFHELLNESQK